VQSLREKLDVWFPTIVRYLGVLLTLILVTASILGRNDYPAAYVAAAGMILYKTVREAAAPPPGYEDRQERWSHLP
jgi:hypothetical protein